MELEANQTPEELSVSTPARIAKLLGLEITEETDELWLADKVANGLRATSTKPLIQALGKHNIVGRLIPESSLRRATKSKKRLSKELSERLYEMSKVLDAVSTAYRGDRDAIERFLNQPHQLLDGRTPYSVAASGSAGSDAVVGLVGRAQAGIAL